jgi:hypothetical protein
MLQQVISVSLLSAFTVMSPVASQGIRGTISGTPAYVAPATRVLVATPYPSSSADSSAAVSIGNAVREKLIGKIGGTDWLVITRRDMNTNLQTWGYSPDQLFPPESARQMATAMQARMFVMTTMTKESGGLFAASIRVTGIADEAGQVVRTTQLPGQSAADFGGKIAEQVTVIFKAYPDAKSCTDNLAANKPKAIDGAGRALKVVPNYGLPEYCLGLIEQSKDSVGAEAVHHFTNATIGDPFSLKAFNQLAIIHQKKRDTTGVVGDYQHMITIAPTNQPLAAEAVKIFKQWGRPDAAEQVVAQQIKLDPTNADWPDLQGNSCAASAAGESDSAKAKVKFACAYTAFLQEYTLDPTRADTNFYPKIVFVAGNRADSMLWAKRWADKYTSSADPYKLELSLYMDGGQIDSALNVVKVLGAIDPTDTRPTLAIDMALLKARRYDDAIKLSDYFQKNGDETAKNQYAGLLVQQADSESRRTPHDDSLLVHLGQAIVAFNPPNKQYFDFGNYFITAGLTSGLQVLSQTSRTDKSCGTVKRYEVLLNQMAPPMAILVQSSNPSLVTYATGLSTTIQDELKRMPELEKAFCKP